ncbi:MAG: hypothetical protein JWM10_480, partial [Myxococcaceae bacterium]|nr:hypothetical protein [Myxococcaceae bacterium]
SGTVVVSDAGRIADAATPRDGGFSGDAGADAAVVADVGTVGDDAGAEGDDAGAEEDAGHWGEDDAGDFIVDEPPAEAQEVPTCSVGAVGSRRGGNGGFLAAALLAVGVVVSRRRRG